MNIHIERAGKKYGPYSRSEARKYFANGELLPTDLAWYSGTADWVPLATLFPDVTVPKLDARSAVSGGVPPRPSKRIARPLIIVGAVLIAIVYLLSPYFALWKLKGALESGNQTQLEAQIDFPSVRDGLKADLRAHFANTASKEKDSKDDPLASMMAAVAPALADGVIDSVITPSGLVTLIEGSKAFENESGDKTDPKSSDGSSGLSKVKYAFFTSPTNFLVDVDDVRLRLTLKGLEWKVTRLEVSPEKFEGMMK